MALFNTVEGTWGIGGFKLPDRGITEWLFGGNTGKASWLNNPNVYQAIGTNPQEYANTLSTNKLYSNYTQGTGFNPYGPTVTSLSKPINKTTNTGGSRGGGAPSVNSRGERLIGYNRNGDPVYSGGNTGPSPQDEYYNRIRSNIESGFNQYLSNLDRLAGLIPQMQQEQQGYLNQQFNSMLGQLGTEKQAAEQQIGTYRQDVQARKQAGMDEISQNLRNLMKATEMQLGAMGAGSSSAAQVIAPYALSKQGSRAQAQVIKGANDQLAELDRKMIDVQKTYDTQKSQIEQWKADKMSEIANTYNDLKFKIEQAKANAPIDKMNALNNLDQTLLQNALQMANYYEQTANQYKMGLDQWVRDRISQLQDFKIQLSKSANFNPTELTYDALQGLQGQPQTSYEFYNPVLVNQIRRRLGLAQ
jgi:hypothetical protein